MNWYTGYVTSCNILLLLKATQYDVSGALRWLSGSLNGMTMKSVPSLFVVVVVFGTIIVLLTKYLQVLELGDEFCNYSWN